MSGTAFSHASKDSRPTVIARGFAALDAVSHCASRPTAIAPTHTAVPLSAIDRRTACTAITAMSTTAEGIVSAVRSSSAATSAMGSQRVESVGDGKASTSVAR